MTTHTVIAVLALIAVLTLAAVVLDLGAPRQH